MVLDIKHTYLLLGSNLGNRELLLQKAQDLISEKIGNIFSKSAIYETAAWGKTDQPNFLNIALGVKTNLHPKQLLITVLAIEKELGRVREEKWGARLIDIDIILYGDEIVSIGEELQIPHPEMQNRKFVMEPLVEIAPDLYHPVLKKQLKAILLNLEDNLVVNKR